MESIRALLIALVALSVAGPALGAPVIELMFGKSAALAVAGVEVVVRVVEVVVLARGVSTFGAATAAALDVEHVRRAFVSRWRNLRSAFWLSLLWLRHAGVGCGGWLLTESCEKLVTIGGGEVLEASNDSLYDILRRGISAVSRLLSRLLGLRLVRCPLRATW